MKRLLLIILIFLVCFNTKSQTTKTEGFHFLDRDRSYIIHLPPDFLADKSLPLVFNLHGLWATAEDQRRYTQMDSLADSENFIVCYPQGIKNSWNLNGKTKDLDEVAFFSTLIDTLQARYNIDLDRVYSCGKSNGAFMSYVLGVKLSNKITAVAAIAGGFFLKTFTGELPPRVVPAMEFHGTKDKILPHDVKRTITSVAKTVDYWLKATKCLPQGDTILIPDINKDDKSTARRIEYRNKNGKLLFVHYEIIGGGHTWPSENKRRKWLFGNNNKDVNASEEIWRFFKNFRLSDFQ